MDTVSTQLMVVLDPNSMHGWIDQRLACGILVRLIDAQACLDHFRVHGPRFKEQGHFFLPDTQSNLLNPPEPHLEKLRIYLFCHDQQSLEANQALYQERARFEVFLSDELQFAILHAEVALVRKLLKRSEAGSRDRDKLAEKKREVFQELEGQFDQFVSTQLSVEVAEHLYT